MTGTDTEGPNQEALAALQSERALFERLAAMDLPISPWAARVLDALDSLDEDRLRTTE